MYFNQESAPRRRMSRSISKSHSVKGALMRITKIVRTNTVRMGWIMFTFAPMVMLYNAARADESVTTQRVRFKDLNLDSPEGAAVLYVRIKGAASLVCGRWDHFDLLQAHAVRTCINGAVSRAVAQVNSPGLTSIYNEKIGKADKKIITVAQSR
jgi:UrcA family protein